MIVFEIRVESRGTDIAVVVLRGDNEDQVWKRKLESPTSPKKMKRALDQAEMYIKGYRDAAEDE